MNEKTLALVKKTALGALAVTFAVINFFACQPAMPVAIAGELVTVKPPHAAAIRSHWPKMATIPSGTMLRVSLNSTLRTDREKTGDGFMARLCESVRVGDMTVLPSGTSVRGHLLLVAEPYTTAGKAKVTLVFDRIVDPSGRILAISSRPIVFVGQGNKTSDRDRLTKLSPVKPEDGASAGGVIILATKSQQIELPSNQRFSIQLDESLLVSVAELTASR